MVEDIWPMAAMRSLRAMSTFRRWSRTFCRSISSRRRVSVRSRTWAAPTGRALRYKPGMPKAFTPSVMIATEGVINSNPVASSVGKLPAKSSPAVYSVP